MFFVWQLATGKATTWKATIPATFLQLS